MLKTGGFDISCQYHLNPFVDWFYLPKSPSRTAMVAFVHDVRPHEARVPNTLEHVFLKGTYRAADELVVYHVSLKSSLVEEFGLNAKNIHVLRHPLHPPAPGLRPSVVDGPLRVLFFGTFRANKGLEVLIRAAASLRHQSGITFHVAGRGNHDLESLVARASAELPNLTCEIGYVDRQRREQLFRTSHLVVLPYTTMESQSGVLATAYSNALPLVVSDVGALGKTVSEDGTGLVIPPGDPASLCEAISRVAHRPDLIPQFSDAIHAAASMYSHETVGRALRDVFESAAERRQRRLQGLTAQKNRLGRAHRDELLGRTLEHEHAD
jgi:glycosyltransferase involved in cell wall biosynthesis